MKKIGIKILLFIFLLFATTTQVNAQDPGPTMTGKIGLTYQYGEEVFENRHIFLYQVATFDENDNLIYKEDFKGNREIKDLTTSELSELAIKLSKQAKDEKLSTYELGITDTNGKVEFESLPYGLYLVQVEEVQKGDYQYISSPMLITLPNFDEVTNAYISEIETITKTEEKKIDKPAPEKPNDKPEEPQKNNNNIRVPYTFDAIVIYILIFSGSIIAILLLGYFIIKQKKEEKNEN